MMGLLLSLTLAAAAATSTGSAVEGSIPERSLQRTVQLVYLEKVEGEDAKALTVGAVMNQKNNTYVPHLLPIVAGSQVTLQTGDAEMHNIYAKQGEDVLFNTAFAPAMPPRQKTFSDAGVIALTCNIHSEMSAFIVVLQNRFFTLPVNGAFKIEGVPTGKYELRIWGEKLDPKLLEKRFPVEVPSTGGVTIQLSGTSI